MTMDRCDGATARTPAASASPASPKAAASGSARSVSSCAGCGQNARNAPGRNFTPAAQPVPRSVHPSRCSRIPNTPSTSSCTARLTDGKLSSCS